MSLVKPIAWIIVLGAIGYFAYTTFNKPPAPEPTAGEWGATPQIQLGPPGSPTSNPSAATAGMAPTYTQVQSLAPPVGAPQMSPPPAPAPVTTLPANTVPPANFANSTTMPGMIGGAGLDRTPVAGGPQFPTPLGTPLAGQTGSTPNDPYILSQRAAPPVGNPAPTAGPPGTLRDALLQARPLQEAHKLVEVLRLLTPWYDDSRLMANEETALNELLDGLAGEVVYSRSHLLASAYMVKPGDRLEVIAAQYKVPWQLLVNINGIANPNVLTPGTELKVMNGPFAGVVNGQKHTLTLYVQDCYAGRFPIGLGSQARLDVTSFVVTKKPDPQPASVNADPAKLFWVELDPMIPNSDHMTLHPSSDPDHPDRDGAQGCFSLSPRDAKDVYEILSLGSRVTVRK